MFFIPSTSPAAAAVAVVAVEAAAYEAEEEI